MLLLNFYFNMSVFSTQLEKKFIDVEINEINKFDFNLQTFNKKVNKGKSNLKTTKKMM